MGIRHFSISPELLGAIALANSPGSVDKPGEFWYQYQYNIMIFIKIQNEDSDYIVTICGELDPKRNKNL
jgi:hypothetical protein